MDSETIDIKPPRRARRAVFVLVGCLLLVGSLLVTSGLPASAGGTEYKKVNVLLTISYAPNSYIIGNAYPGWHDVIQLPTVRAGGHGSHGFHYYAVGYLIGPEFDSCAWIPAGFTTPGPAATNECTVTDPSQPDQPHSAPNHPDQTYFVQTFTDGEVTPGGNGNPVGLTRKKPAPAGCGTGYGNVEPWRVHATPGNSRTVPASDTLLGRYVSRDHGWVLVLDTSSHSATLPDWFFMARGCFVTIPF